MHVALGEIPAPQAEWRLVREEYVPGMVFEEEGRQCYYDQWCQLTEPLMSGDRAALARLRHNWESFNVVGTKLEPPWHPTPFSLESAE